MWLLFYEMITNRNVDETINEEKNRREMSYLLCGIDLDKIEDGNYMSALTGVQIHRNSIKS